MQKGLSVRWLRILCAAAVCAFLFAQPVAAQKESKAIAEARDLDQQLAAAMNAKDADKFLAQYSKNADLFFSQNDDRVTRGWDALAKEYGEVFAGAESLQLAVTDCSYWTAGDGVLGDCAFDYKAKLKSGGNAAENGRQTTLRKKIGGKWVIVYEHDSIHPLPPAADASLYKRVGGYDALAAVSDDFLGRLLHDAELGKFFQGVNQAHAQRIRQHVVDFLCMATGGPCVYAGRDMKSTHAGLGITGAHWDRMAGLLNQTMDKFSVPDRERKEIFGALGGLKADIVDKP